MSASEDRVQQALAAHLGHLELGGPAPDVSHLSDVERARLAELIALLDETAGVGFGRGLGEAGGAEPAPMSEAGGRVVAALREVLPSGARIAGDPAAGAPAGVPVAEGWLLGTFGGRIRVWLLEHDGALAESDGWLRELGRFFGLFPETAAIALVEPGLQCLLVQPEDCAPAIEVPLGSIVARRYRRPIAPIDEALTVFLRELIPTWEPMQGADEMARIAIDVPPIAEDRARRAIEDQVAAGGRARKTNPKRTALTGLGDADASALARLVLGTHEGTVSSDELEAELRRLAENR